MRRATGQYLVGAYGELSVRNCTTTTFCEFQGMRDDLWVLLREQFEHARMILWDAPVETRQDALDKRIAGSRRVAR